MEKFDAIIVGGGLAGLAAGFCLANAGVNTLLVERGNFCGGKNVSGGRLYGHSMETLIPGFAGEAPIERKIVSERLALLTKDGGLITDYRSNYLENSPSYSVIRGSFDRWLAGKAEKAGCTVITGIRVDEVLTKEGRVCGIRAEGDEVCADVVILADGVNSLLSKRLGMKKELDPFEVAVGIKEVIQLDEKTINERFGVGAGDGTALMATGYITGGHMGGGFLYTNSSTISVGIVTTVGDIGHTDLSTAEMIERFKEHPCIRPLLEGGKTIEYMAHLVPEGGYRMLPELTGDGVLLAGDSAGFVMNLGYTVRGMDLAIESGRLAAEAVIRAKEVGDFSKEGLALYEEKLNQSFVLKELRHYQCFPEFMESSHRLYNDYSRMADALMGQLYTVDGKEPVDLAVKALRSVKQVGLLNLVADGIKGLGAL